MQFSFFQAHINVYYDEKNKIHQRNTISIFYDRIMMNHFKEEKVWRKNFVHFVEDPQTR